MRAETWKYSLRYEKVCKDAATAISDYYVEEHWVRMISSLRRGGRLSVLSAVKNNELKKNGVKEEYRQKMDEGWA